MLKTVRKIVIKEFEKESQRVHEDLAWIQIDMAILEQKIENLVRMMEEALQ